MNEKIKKYSNLGKNWVGKNEGRGRRSVNEIERAKMKGEGGGP